MEETEMKRAVLCGLTAALLILVASDATAAAGDALVLTVVAEVEIKTINEAGEPDVARIEAARVVPGDEVIYTISCENVGSEKAENVLITNPIPEHMRYVRRTAESDGSTVLFSVDGGRTFGAPEDLVVPDSEGSERRAVESDYTHIRWTLDAPLAPDEIRQVAYRAILE
jgi:uncharacterized repeat protein (TIGR01451 family)